MFRRLRKDINMMLESGTTLDKVCAYLREQVNHFDWVGFYLARGEELILGPFSGEPTEHVRIPFGSGICGQAAATKKTFLIPDVRSESNYLACSVHVRSEIVVPLLRDGKIIAEIDIDSHTPDAFSQLDRQFLEELADRITALDIL